MSNNDYLINIRNHIATLQMYGDDNIFREHLGTQSLISQKNEYNDILQKLSLILEKAINLSTATSLKLFQVTSGLIEIFNRVNAFSEVEYVTKRSGIINDLDKLFDQFREIWQNIGWMIEGKLNFPESEIDKILRLNSQLENDLTTAQTLKNSLEQQINEFKERYSSINTNIELETQVHIFEVQAKKDKIDSQKWLWSIVISGAILFTTLVLIYLNLNLPAQVSKEYISYNSVCETCGQQTLWVDMLRHLFFKLLILSTEIYILSFCVKNYNACMHNKTNNEHRQNSFAAALHFYNTTTSERREEILIKVADAIFTYQKSGYYGKDSEPSNPSIIQSVIEKVSNK